MDLCCASSRRARGCPPFFSGSARHAYVGSYTVPGLGWVGSEEPGTGITHFSFDEETGKLSGGTVALGLGLGFGGALRGRGGFFLGWAWAFFWVRSRARRHVASASRFRSARRSLSASSTVR